MIKEFTIKNFKSINKEITLTMEADVDRVSELSSHIIDIHGNKLLKVCSMYGPNGGGKSNIIDALLFLRKLIYAGYIINDSSTFSFAFANEDVSEFTVFFTGDSYDVGYNVRFTTSKQINQSERELFTQKTTINILNESVYALNDNKMEYKEICSRDINGFISFSNKTLMSNVTPLGSSLSMVRYLYEYYQNDNAIKTIKDLEGVFNVYREVANIVQINSASPALRFGNLVDFVNNNKDRLLTTLRAADIYIDDIVAEKNEIINKIYFIRKVVVDGEQVLRKLDLSEESKGTQKLFNLLLTIIYNQNRNVIYLGDDINAYLHPKLLSAVIGLFTSEKNTKNQFIFNSHDITNMNKETFRRDEIWFVYRDEKYQTNLIPLSNITNYKGKQIRNDAIYSKQYLEGKYGADPFIEKGLYWNE